MADGSFGHARAICAGLAAWLLIAPGAVADEGPAPPEPQAPAIEGIVDLLGAWHVLVHYTDDNSTHPDQLRWHDRLWVFERSKGKLVWTEYPIVVFSDDTERFEQRAGGQYARVLGGWEPSEAQLGNIRAGLRTNSRGMKSKKLRGSDEEGWATHAKVRNTSASVITYQENWSVVFRAGLPQFEHHDVMGSARAESLEGVTRYAVEARPAGGLLTGSYERDGTRRGRFWMRRSGGRLGLDEADRPLPGAED
jgi:hypothetical protein